jgi:hypothetical protein
VDGVAVENPMMSTVSPSVSTHPFASGDAHKDVDITLKQTASRKASVLRKAAAVTATIMTMGKWRYRDDACKHHMRIEETSKREECRNHSRMKRTIDQEAKRKVRNGA